MARLDQRDGLSVTVVSNALRLRRFTPPTMKFFLGLFGRLPKDA